MLLSQLFNTFPHGLKYAKNMKIKGIADKGEKYYDIELAQVLTMAQFIVPTFRIFLALVGTRSDPTNRIFQFLWFIEKGVIAVLAYPSLCEIEDQWSLGIGSG